MAVNPITSDSLTLDFKSLMKVPVGDRVKAAAYDQAFLQSILTALTPIQVAQAFPDYFRRQLPDVSNFITSNIVARNGGRFDQTGGGAGGSSYPYYDSGNNIGAGARPLGSELTVEQMKKKLLEKGIDVDGILNSVGQNGLLEDDPALKAIKGMSDDKLSDVGLQRITKPDGSTIIIQKASEVNALTDQEVSDRISGKFVAKENADEKQRAVIDFANRWNISPEAAAGVLKIESGVSSDIAGGASGNYHGVFQLQSEQIAGLTQKAGFGALSPEQYRKLSVADQLKVMDEYYKQAGITPEFFTGDPTTDASKMWAIQLAPSNAKSIDYTDPNAVISNTQQAAIIRQNGIGAVTVGSAGAGSVAGGQEFLGESYERIEGNATPEQISKARVELAKEEQRKRQDALTKKLYNEFSPTSSEYVADASSPKFTILKGNIEEVDPRLQNVIMSASSDLPDGYTVKAISGKDIRTTGTKNHPAGLAMDVQIYDGEGKLVPHNSNSPGWKYYEMLYRSAHIRGQEMYPEEKFIWGGAWISDAAGRGDPMHYQIVDPTASGTSQSSGQYSFESGLDPSHPFITEGGQLSADEREAYDNTVKKKIEKEKEEAKAKAEQTVQAESITPAPTEHPVPQKALGGNIYGVNEDITLVNTETGTPIAQVNNDEKLIKQGSELQVTSESKIKAEELGQQLDTSEDEEPVPQEQQNANQVRQVNRQQPVNNDSDKMWRQTVAERQREDSPSYARAMTRTKFGREGNHFNRAAPGSIS